MKFPSDAAYDVLQNSGGGQFSLRKMVRNNPPESPFFPTADDYGCLGWTLDPADVLTAAQLTVSTTLYGAMLVIPNACTVNRLTFFPHAVQGAETNFNGVALYSPVYTSGVITSLSQVAVSANQSGWTGITPDTAVDAPFSATANITPGYYWATWLGSTGGTAMSLHGALGTLSAVLNFSKKTSQETKYRAFTLATQTTMPATITLSGVTASAFVPAFALS